MLHSGRGDRAETPRKTDAIFAPTGEYWTIGYAGKNFSLKGSKGLSYIHRLLQHQGEEFHALDLLQGPGGGQVAGSERPREEWSNLSRDAGVGDAGEMLDAQAKQDYRRKLTQLEDALGVANELSNSERAAEIQSEIDFIARELHRAVGMWGRDRRAGSAVERARLNVSRAIKSAIERVSEHHTELGKLLARSIHTGLFCSYVIDSSNPIKWQFSLAVNLPAPSAVDPPIFPRSESAFAQALAGRTTFVGREEESATLEKILQQTRDGRGRVVMISGPAGVGKTRMAAEFCERASRNGVIAFPGGCSDREDPVPFLPFVEILEAALASAADPRVFRAALGDEASELARLMPQLRRIFDDIPPPLEVPPEQSRRLLLGSFSRVIERASVNRPIVLVLEDLQWADEGTLSMLDHLAKAAPKMRLMVIGTFREADWNPVNSLGDTLGGLTRAHVLERIGLRGLSESAVADMLTALSGQQPPPSLVSLIYANTEGNPFFVEELFQHLAERGKLFEPNGSFRETIDLAVIDVPRSVRLVIDRRLARLTDGTRKVLGSAAAIEGAFTFELLQSACGVDADTLLDSMDEAESAGLISSALQYPLARFKFSHELIRRTLLDGYSAARRQRLHLKIAEAIEQLHKNALPDHAEDLAYHLWHAGLAADPQKTIRFLTLAGEQAVHRSAMLQASRHFKSALELIGAIPEGDERVQQELALQTSLGSALLATQGFSSLEVGRAFARARTLSQDMGETPELFRVVWGLWINYASRSEYAAAFEMAEQCLRLAQSSKDTGLLVEAYHALGVTCCIAGEFAKAIEHLEQAISHYDPIKHEHLRFVFGQDPAVACMFHAGWALWFLGYPDKAIKRNDESITLARRLNHPATLATAMAFGALPYQLCRDSRSVEELATEAIAVSTNNDSTYIKGFGLVLGGWARAQRKLTDDGIAKMRLGLDALRAVDAVLMLAYFSSLLAEVYGQIGQASQGLQVLNEIDSSRDRYWVAELDRLRGELTLKQAGSARAREGEATAEECFRRALNTAHEQNAKSLELRAAVSLSRLLAAQGKRAEALTLMSEQYASFGEGFETQDLREARKLIAELEKHETSLRKRR